MALIALQGVGFSFQNHAVFQGLDLTLSERRVAVIGRNGSGKSTLARLIAGLLEPDAGELRVEGFDPYHDRKEAVAAIGIVFQNPDHQIIFPTVIEELQFGFASLGKAAAREKADSVLAKYGKSDWRDRLVHDLSQGQRHFIALISILEMEPRVLILDEPFTGLDIPTVMRLSRLLDDYEGMIVHITHEVGLVEAYDRVIWMENGALQGDGDVAEVLPQYLAQMKAWGEDDAHTGF